MSLRGALLLPLLCCAALVQAHEVRPGYLEFTEGRAGDLRIVWRQPIAGNYAVPLVPDVSTGWLRGEPYSTSRTETTYVREWHVPAPHVELAGVTVEVLQDGKPVTEAAGRDVKEGKVTVTGSRLYNIVNNPGGAAEHTLELIIDSPGLQAFTFTFG